MAQHQTKFAFVNETRGKKRQTKVPHSGMYNAGNTRRYLPRYIVPINPQTCKGRRKTKLTGVPGVHGRDESSRQPLLEPDRDKQKPPLAGPEIDDLDDEVDKPPDTGPYPGIDDGLLEVDGPTLPGLPHNGVDSDKHPDSDGDHTTHDEGVGTDDGKWPLSSEDEIDYPYGDWSTSHKPPHSFHDGTTELGNRFGDDRPISPFPAVTPNMNTYQQKKNLAQGMMDLALLSANANQLRYVLESSSTHPYYYPSVTFITLSIILQVAVGVGLIMNSRYDVNEKDDICKADKINNMTVLGVFLVTIVNVFITSFSVASPTAPPN